MGFFQNISGSKIRRGNKTLKKVEKNVLHLASRTKPFDKRDEAYRNYDRILNLGGRMEKLQDINKANKLRSIRDRAILTAPLAGAAYLMFSKHQSDKNLQEQ